jgi:hypothetical protein
MLPSMRYKAPNSPPNGQTASSLCCHSFDAPNALRRPYSADLAYRPLTAGAGEARSYGQASAALDGHVNY